MVPSLILSHNGNSRSAFLTQQGTIVTLSINDSILLHSYPKRGPTLRTHSVAQRLLTPSSQPPASPQEPQNASKTRNQCHNCPPPKCPSDTSSEACKLLSLQWYPLRSSLITLDPRNDQWGVTPFKYASSTITALRPNGQQCLGKQETIKEAGPV